MEYKKPIANSSGYHTSLYVYLIPAKIIPSERQIVCYLEGSVLVEEGELAAAAGPSREPDHHGVLLLVAPRFEEEVEQPTHTVTVRAPKWRMSGQGVPHEKHGMVEEDGGGWSE